MVFDGENYTVLSPLMFTPCQGRSLPLLFCGIVRDLVELYPLQNTQIQPMQNTGFPCMNKMWFMKKPQCRKRIFLWLRKRQKGENFIGSPPRPLQSQGGIADRIILYNLIFFWRRQKGKDWKKHPRQFLFFVRSPGMKFITEPEEGGQKKKGSDQYRSCE